MNEDDVNRRKSGLTFVRRATEELLEVVDPEPYRDGIKETPERVARMWVDELTQGYNVDIPALFKKFDGEKYEGQVIVKDIPVKSICEHHLVPIIGHAHIAYFPKGKVVGLSKLARLVNAYAQRLQVQERLTQQILDAINTHMQPRGAIVTVEAEHMCMTMRGIQAPGTRTITCTATGLFIEEQGAKEEFLTLINRNGKH